MRDVRWNEMGPRRWMMRRRWRARCWTTAEGKLKIMYIPSSEIGVAHGCARIRPRNRSENGKRANKELVPTRGGAAAIIRRSLEIVANLIGFICCVLEIYDKAGRANGWQRTAADATSGSGSLSLANRRTPSNGISRLGFMSPRVAKWAAPSKLNFRPGDKSSRETTNKYWWLGYECAWVNHFQGSSPNMKLE